MWSEVRSDLKAKGLLLRSDHRSRVLTTLLYSVFPRTSFVCQARQLPVWIRTRPPTTTAGSWDTASRRPARRLQLPSTCLRPTCTCLRTRTCWTPGSAPVSSPSRCSQWPNDTDDMKVFFPTRYPLSLTAEEMMTMCSVMIMGGEGDGGKALPHHHHHHHHPSERLAFLIIITLR